VAAQQEFSWPPVRTFLSAYKENLTAADTHHGERRASPVQGRPARAHGDR
jgi:hypothetical protein